MTDTPHIHQYKSASLVLSPTDLNNYRLYNLRSATRGQGHATALLKQVTDWADDNDAGLYLTVQAYGRQGILTNNQLQAFYEKFGFVRTNTTRPVQMCRTSQKKHAL